MFYPFLRDIAKRFWPDIALMQKRRQVVSVGDVITTLYGFTLAAIGLVWLFAVTDWTIFHNDWFLLTIHFALIAVFYNISFFLIVELREDRYGSSVGSFDSMIALSGVFLVGPTALWLMVFWNGLLVIWNWRNQPNTASRWNFLRDAIMQIAENTIPYLIAFAIYAWLGGEIPIPNLMVRTLWNGMLTILIAFSIGMFQWTPYIVYALWTQKLLAGESQQGPILNFFAMARGIPALATPFALLSASLYTLYGIPAFLFLMSGILVAAFLTRRFSQVAESSRQQSRQIDRLESLGRAILNAPPDASTLPEILHEHAPNMFPSGNMAIWLTPDDILYQVPDNWGGNNQDIIAWVGTLDEVKIFLPGEKRPWVDGDSRHRAIVAIPINSHEGADVIGGIYLELRNLGQVWNNKSLNNLVPAILTLSDQIASAINQADNYARALAYESVSQELRLAGQIQASFIPNEFPNVPGWQLAVTLEPASGLSGDFFDFIPLSRGRLGIVIADVTDHGLGAALYMAMGRTLLRTYAFESPGRPDIVFSETNERLLSDARANLFITAFYGVLDPAEGTLTYSNAGHNPPFLLTPKTGQECESLIRTGMPIGIEQEARWERKTVSMGPGDTLILYTDGIPDCQNEEGEFFDDQRIIDVALENMGQSAFTLQAGILKKLHGFRGDAQQMDDITLMVLSRDLA